MFSGIGSDVFNSSLFQYYVNINLIELEFISSIIKILPLTLSFIGIGLYVILLKFKLFTSLNNLSCWVFSN